MTRLSRALPAGFTWGVATSAFQVEGASTADGRGESIWDRFCAVPGNIADGSDGSVACDHYHRYAGDVALMREFGFDAYRFSIAWPRVVPEGRGAPNVRGLDFYDRLVDELLANGLTPFPTLYHWDLPQALEDRGGWPDRSTAEAFADYTGLVVDRLGDRVRQWTTINEPYVVATHGYLTGEHAPGRSDLGDTLAAAHHVLLAHGLANEAIRASSPDAEVGIVLNFTPVEAVGDSPLAVARQRVHDEFENRWYVEPVAGLGYPEFTAGQLGWEHAEVRPGDLDVISAPIDFLGVNFYSRQMVGAFDGEHIPRGAETAMGWEIHPSSLGELLRSLDERYGFPKIYVTENGAAMPDGHRVDGRVDDDDRIEYYCDHLDQVLGAIDGGVPVEGYFAWSFLDNFEWAHGYRYRFGIVEVEAGTLRRIPKKSALWLARLARDMIDS